MNLSSVLDIGGHVISMGAFGYAGYWAWRWDIASTKMIQIKRAEIQEKRRIKQEKLEAASAQMLEQA